MTEHEKELGQEFDFFKSKKSFKNKWIKFKSHVGEKIGSFLGYSATKTYSFLKTVNWHDVTDTLIISTQNFIKPIVSITCHAVFISFILSYMKILPVDKQLVLIQGHEANQFIFSMANLYIICWVMGSILKFLYNNAVGKDIWINIFKPFQLILFLAFFVPNPDGITPIAQIISYFIVIVRNILP